MLKDRSVLGSFGSWQPWNPARAPTVGCSHTKTNLDVSQPSVFIWSAVWAGFGFIPAECEIVCVDWTAYPTHEMEAIATIMIKEELLT